MAKSDLVRHQLFLPRARKSSILTASVAAFMTRGGRQRAAGRLTLVPEDGR